MGIAGLRYGLAVALFISQTVVSARTEPANREDDAGAQALIVGVTRAGWPPFNSVMDGTLNGLSAAYLAAALGAGHPPFSVRAFESQAALLAAACRGEVDVVPDEAKTAESDSCLIFSEPYYQGQVVALTRDGDQAMITDGRLPTATYAVDDASFMLRTLRRRYPDAKFLRVHRAHEALESVASGKADLYFGLRPAVGLELQDGALPTLAMTGAPADPLGQLRFAFPRSRVALRDRIDQGLARIDAESRTKLLSRWITVGLDESANATQKAPAIVLSDSERAFLARLGPLKAAMIVRWAPFSYLDEAGQPAGILPEYLGVIARSLGIRFDQYAQQTPAAEGRALASGAADLIVYVLPDRLDKQLPGVTQPIDTYPVVIVGRRNASTVSGIAQLAHQRVAVVERSNNLELLRAGAPSAIPVETGSVQAAMQLVHDDKADAMMGNLAVIDMLLQRRYAGELKVLGPTGSQQAIGFQVRPEFAPLIPLMNRAIAAVPEAQRAEIHNRYLTTHYELGPSWDEIARRAAPAVLIGFLSIGVLAVGYLRLRQEVRQRQETEQALRTQLSFRSTLLDMVPFPIGVRDSRGVYLDVNAAAEKAMGLSRHVVIGRTIEECVAISDMQGTLTSHILTTTQRDTTYDAMRVDFKDAYGESRHGLYWHRPFRDDSGNVAGTVGAVVDVTALLEAERKAHETEARLEDVTHSLPAAVFQMRREVNGALSYQYLGSNQALLPDIRRGGLRLERDRHPLVLPRREMLHLIAAIDESARSLRPLDATFRVGEAAGVQWLKIRAVPRREADGATLFNGYWSDTTRDQLRNAELEAARIAAESASKAKDQFVAMMSHEIRTPMSGVLGLVEMLSRTELGDEQATMVGMVHESAGALLQILDDVLDYSKIQADRLTIEEAPFDLREVVDAVLGLLAMRAHQKSLTLRCRVGAGVAAKLRGDSVRLRQILFNLVGNAIKFTASGSVSLTVELDSDADDRQALCMTVVDTGIGIDEKVIPTLFSPFVQGESSTSRRFGGTGLGLVICRKLLTMMNGDIAIHSKPGVGTTVTVNIMLPVESRLKSKADETTMRGARAVVLVRDAEVARGVADGVAALGARADLLDPFAARTPDAANDPPHADIVFVDEDAAPPPAWRAANIIRVTRQPEATGYRVTGAGVFVSVNPLSFRGLRGAWQQAAGSDMPRDARGLTEAVDVRAASVPRSPARTHEEAIRDGVLILVAEDNPVNRYLIRSQLESFGCACDVTEDGAEALAAYERNDYALLITDCQMPRIDGYALANAIRKRERKYGAVNKARNTVRKVARLPIVALTASVGSPEWNRCLEAGMDDYLCKPAQRDVLHACLMRWAPRCLQCSEEDAECVTADGASSASTAISPMVGDANELPRFDWDAINRSMGGTCRQGVLIDLVVESLHNEAATLRDLIEEAEVTALHQWIHKMRGAASMLCYQPLLDALAEFVAAMTPGEPGRLRTAGGKLLNTLELIAAHASRLVSESRLELD